MCGPYWSQWDKEDLDSWHGKDYHCDDQDDDHYDSDEEKEVEEGCSCGSYCFDCLGMSWRDFM